MKKLIILILFFISAQAQQTEIRARLYPKITNTYSLGNSALWWDSIYVSYAKFVNLSASGAINGFTLKNGSGVDTVEFGNKYFAKADSNTTKNPITLSYALSNLVPYTGASSDVDLGVHTINSGSITVNNGTMTFPYSNIIAGYNGFLDISAGLVVNGTFAQTASSSNNISLFNNTSDDAYATITNTFRMGSSAQSQGKLLFYRDGTGTGANFELHLFDNSGNDNTVLAIGQNKACTLIGTLTLPNAHTFTSNAGNVTLNTKFISDSIDAVFIGNTIYGEMQGNNINVTVAVPSADTMFQVASGLSGGLENGFTFQNSKELKCLIAGKYRIVWSMSVETVSTNKEIEGSYMVNGVSTGKGEAHTEVSTGGASRPQTISASANVTLAVNDLVSLCVSDHTDGSDPVVQHASLTINWIGK